MVTRGKMEISAHHVGGAYIQLRHGVMVLYFDVGLLRSKKGWYKSWFYLPNLALGLVPIAATKNYGYRGGCRSFVWAARPAAPTHLSLEVDDF